ncbi:hypothetical protein VFPFJ_10425 [Purpureocillium lilacinum]|uniref:Uncharacterized protein n=1 Tax=Purpureocillium lilacinum TaxID=33203 RepID=A0A179GHC9_PURLI|nr:hypothetical protein VFPFJ_10425 [Purpureocillium lilacinum]OAQ76888.1 hypothetical protein VFPFJ_10425 [Purpureocillium lilacinum]
MLRSGCQRNGVGVGRRLQARPGANRPAGANNNKKMKKKKRSEKRRIKMAKLEARLCSSSRKYLTTDRPEGVTARKVLFSLLPGRLGRHSGSKTEKVARPILAEPRIEQLALAGEGLGASSVPLDYSSPLTAALVTGEALCLLK